MTLLILTLVLAFGSFLLGLAGLRSASRDVMQVLRDSVGRTRAGGRALQAMALATLWGLLVLLGLY